MPRPALYSSSRHTRRSPPEPVEKVPAPTEQPAASVMEPSPKPATKPVAGTALSRRPLFALWALIALLTTLLLYSLWLHQRPAAQRITQEDIDAAVLRTLETTTPPSAAARAVEAISPSIVRVVGYGRSKNGKEEVERGIGTGVVIVDKGIILTNLHVVAGADRIAITFHDGLETTASITGAQPENDLAVLQAHKIPDDLFAAPLRSTQDLRPGDHVVAVGFPFGIGPSASAGVVTAILNPTSARTFIGIGFAVPIENAASAVGMPPF